MKPRVITLSLPGAAPRPTTPAPISTSDADGVALAAIQGLNQKVDEQLRAKDARIAALEQAVADLKATLAKLAAQN